MKKLILLSAALALVFCATASLADETATAATDNTNTNTWSAEHLLYGPCNIVAAPLLPPVLGGMSSWMICDIADYDWHSIVSLPYAVPTSFLCGSVIGACLAPVYLVEGLFDTLTLGYFYPEHSQWLKGYARYASKEVGEQWFGNPPEAKVVEEEPAAEKVEEQK
ncbi:hypothetical protein J6T93_02660 [bacterium]|nr:hypothetical protein [bacterium]